MELAEYLEDVKAGKRIVAGSEAHQLMHRMAREAMELTKQINASCDQEEIRGLFSQLTGKPVDETFAIFPPFSADFGKNITVGPGPGGHHHRGGEPHWPQRGPGHPEP